MKNTLLKSNLSNIVCKTLPIFSIIYIALISITPRNANLLTEKIQTDKKENKKSLIIENFRRKKSRHKLYQDFKYHEISKQWYKKSIAKITLNKEGKIIGYKITNIFYPNYFTKTQIKNMISKSRIFPDKKTNIKIVKIYFT